MNLHPAISIELRATDDSTEPLPRRRRAPRTLPITAPLPRIGEIIYLNSTSAWRVLMVVHEWLAPDHLVIVLWLTHAGATHHTSSPPAFAITQ